MAYDSTSSAALNEPGCGMIRPCLDLSTAHMPSTSPNFGQARHVGTGYGYVVWVTGEKGKIPPVPGWLVEIMAYAIQQDCLLVNFDRDAESTDLFRTWEW